MADSTPLLLSHSHSDSEPPPPPPPPPPNHPTLNDIFEQYLGGFGWVQFYQVLLVSLAWIFECQQTFITIFTDEEPTWHCIDQTSCNSHTNICNLSPDTWVWDQPAHTSIISDWSLQCANSFIAGLPSSCLFLGCVIGGFVLGSLADSLGRKNLLTLSCLIMSIPAFLISFCSNLWLYSALKFVSGFGRAGIGACVLVLSSEIVGKRWRGQVGLSGLLLSTIGFLSLPAIAFLTRGSSWRVLYLWTSVPAIIYAIIVHFFVYESPRWLIMQGREQEAIAALVKLSPTHDDEGSIDLKKILIATVTPSSSLATKNNLLSSIKLLLEYRWALKRLLATMVVGFGVGIMYYGMPLNLENLSFDLYLSVALNALMELPAALFVLAFIGRWSKKSFVLVSAIVSGGCSVMCAAVATIVDGGGNGWWKGLQVGLELVSFLSACVALGALTIYVLELFPTKVRNSATSLVRQAQVLSGVLSPLLVGCGKYNPFWSYGVFGLLISFCGLFVIFLPHTNDVIFSDSLEEQENNEKAVSNPVNGA
ncbi:unnamed protein product [Camellia sinensis]